MLGTINDSSLAIAPKLIGSRYCSTRPCVAYLFDDGVHVVNVKKVARADHFIVTTFRSSKRG